MPLNLSEMVRVIHCRPGLLSRLALVWGCLAGATGARSEEASQSLAGNWEVRLDPKIMGAGQGWMEPGVKFADQLPLPGTTDQANLGIPLSVKPIVSKDGLARLHRKFSYIGPAWYRRSIEIPPTWQGRRVLLFLERVLWESQVWLDGVEIGKENSLSTPHQFDLTAQASVGRHELVIRVDNRQQFDIGRSHGYIEDTQSIWNGIAGTIELRATPRIWIEQIEIESDPAKASAKVKIGNRTGQIGEGSLQAKITGPGLAFEVAVPVRWTAEGGEATIDLKGAQALPLWSEFHPSLCTLSVTLDRPGADAVTCRQIFGYRKIAANSTTITLNDLPVFFRGTHEGASFPLTGYPPMDVAEWRRLFRILKEWGLNHMRFHSYCPPEACFAAADEEGIYLQAELPLWAGDLGKNGDAGRVAWVRAEAARIFAAYGNHPSLVLFSLGNELHGQYEFMKTLLAELQQADRRRLYTLTSNRLWVADAPPKVGERDGPPGTDDFLVERAFRVNGKIEGMRGQSFFSEAPNTAVDFRNILSRAARPLLTHEIGQWTVFPNLAEIPKYTGVLRPINLEAIREDLQQAGLLEQAADFTRASGLFSAELYKQELELALRTPGLAGYQLLDLHDYPGQGTAHVGLLDSFWDTKGIADPAAFREAAAPVVPLVRLPKRVFTAGEKLTAPVEWANYSEHPIADLGATWELTTTTGQSLARGTLAGVGLALGANQPGGTIELALPLLEKPVTAVLRIQAPAAKAGNSWKIWIVPPAPAVEAAGVTVTDSLARAKAALQTGARVLYLPPAAALRQHQDTAFLPAFWSPVYFTSQAGTMGLLIHDRHPALADFPTAEHSDWQWWGVLTPAPGAVVLDTINKSLRPIVQVIDSFARNQKLGLVFEARVGRGHLLVSTVNLSETNLTDPMRRQLRASLVHYLASDARSDLVSLNEEELSRLFREEAAGKRSAGEWVKDMEPPPEKKP